MANQNGAENNAGCLRVVKGRDSGRTYALGRGEHVLGNAVRGAGGIDLSDQEGQGPRRMAARQASVTLEGATFRLRDLESPGGTFVNRRRLLPGQAHDLAPGDLIQLGGVQLEFSAGDGARPPAKPAPSTGSARAGSAEPLARPFILARGASCRTWDDFLTVSAQRWGDLRDELTSGRLAAHLAASGRPDMAPRADAPGTPDERLDAWLRALPASTPCRPEVEVNPRSLVVRAGAGGGKLRRTVQVSNIGYGLLRARARIEPAGAAWVALAPPVDGAEVAAPEAITLPIDVTLPETPGARLSATLIVETNGGAVRVPIGLEAARAVDAPPVGGDREESAGGWSFEPLRAWLARTTARKRLLGGAFGGAAGRLALSGLGAVLGLGFGGTASLPGPALAGAVIGAVLGGRAAVRRGGVADLPAGAFAGGVAGLIGAMLVVAACQAVEPLMGPSLSGNPVAQAVLWGLLGAMIAFVSIRLVPPRTEKTS